MNIPFRQYIDLLSQYLRPQWRQVLLLTALLFAGIGFELLYPQVVRSFIDTMQQGGTQRSLIGAALLFLLVVLLQRGAMIATTYVSQTVAWTATNGLRRDLTRHVLGLDMSFHNAHTPGELLERIDDDVDRLANFFSEFVLQILGGILLTVGVLFLLFRENWWVGAVLTLFVVLYVVIHAWDQQWAAPSWRLEREYSAQMASFVEERVAGVRDIQTSGAVAYTVRRFYEVLQRRQWQAFWADIITDLGWGLSKFFYALGTVAGMGMGAWLFLNGTISLGTVYLIINYLAMLNRPLDRIAQQLEDLQRVRVAIERVSELVETRSRVASGQPSSDLSPSTQEIHDKMHVKIYEEMHEALSVRFDNVSFRYHAETPVLDNVSFALEAGQVLGLLGRTGSGKTTIARLLFRLYDPVAGQIRLHDVNICDLPLARLRATIGMVTQDVQLLGASVRDNLTLFNPHISDAAILRGLQQLGLEPWLNTLANGLDTELAANGAGLSAGEAQLLALARVFLKNPGLIILDEASSKLDPATERLLEQALDELLKGRTSIIIAHRLSTIRRADQILILEDGRVKEAGSYKQLAHDPASVLASLLAAGLFDLDKTVDAGKAKEINHR